MNLTLEIKTMLLNEIFLCFYLGVSIIVDHEVPPSLHWLVCHDVVCGDEDRAHGLSSNVLSIHDLDSDAGGVVTHVHAEDLVPDRVEVVLQVGSLAQLSLVQVDHSVGVSPVSARNVEEGGVCVRQISSLHHMDLECSMQEVCFLLVLQHSPLRFLLIHSLIIN